MKKVIPPIRYGNQGETVANLHQALEALGFPIEDAQEKRAQRYGEHTAQTVEEFKSRYELSNTEPDVFDEEAADQINTLLDERGLLDEEEATRFVVRGQIHRDGRPYAGGLVRAFDRDMRSEELLDETETNREGRYEITYTADQFARAEKGRADLRVCVYAADGREIKSSPTLFNAGRVETINLHLDADRRRPSEYERYVATLTPVVQDVSFAELTEDDRAFLRGETGIDMQHLVFLTTAAQHGEQTDLPPELFYGLFRQGLSLSLSGLLAAGPRAHRRALEASLGENVIPIALRDRLDTLLESLQQALLKHAFEPSENGKRPPVAELLATTALPRDTRETFVDLYLKREGSIEDFWQALREHPDFQEDERVDDLQLTLQIGLLTQDNPALVRVLKARQDSDLTSLRDLVWLEETEWKELIDSLADGDDDGIPPHVPGDTREERRDHYAYSIVETLKAAFPTPFVGLGLARESDLDEDPVHQGLVRFFENEPGFELAGTQVDTYLAEHESALEGVSEAHRAAVVDRLKATQRVFRVTPRYEHLRSLMQEGLDSAYAIASYPKRTFVQRFGEALGGKAKARAYYTSAQHITATNTNAYTSIYQELHDALPFAIGGSTEQKKQKADAIATAADWPSLFGRINLCACEHCRSLYSPAAYFVDLMEFLRKSLPHQGKTPLHVLLDRRPDLEHIKLTCENTNTPLPYVDLVNEILEYYIAHGTLEKEAAHDTEDISAEELSINPQYTIEAAYDELRDAIYPLTFPFNRPLEVVRAYLEHLGSSRYQIMEVFQTNGQPSDIDRASEYLRLSPQEREILTGNTPTPLHAFYGYAESDAAGWQEDIAAVPTFLGRTGLSYVDLLALVKTRFVNPNETIVLTLVDPDEQEDGPIDACDPSNLRLDGLDEAALSRMHRFIRLQRKLDWSTQDLDKTFTTLSAVDVDDSLLQKLAQVVWLHRELKNEPLVPLLSLWGDLDTHGEDALYPKLFLNKAVLNPVDQAFILNDSGTELADTSETMAAHVPAILAALRIGETELSAIREVLGIADENAPLTLANLSALYRHALLASAMKLKVGDLLALKTLSGVDPFQADNPAPTVAFVQVVDTVRDSAFSVEELNYLYRHLTEPARPLRPSEEHADQVAKQLKTGLEQIAAETTPVPDPTGEQTRQKLGLLWEEATVEPFMALLHGSVTYSTPLASLPEPIAFPEGLRNKASYDAEAQALRFAGPMSLDERTTLLSLSSDQDYQDAVNALFEHPRAFLSDIVSDPNVDTAFLDLSEATDKLLDHPPATIEEQFGYVLAHLLPYLRETLSRGLVVQILSTALDLQPATTRLLLEEVLQATGDPAQPAMADLLPLDEVAFAVNYLRLHKVSLVINDFALTAREVAYLSAHPADFAGFDLNALPLDRTDPVETDSMAVTLFEQWQRLYDVTTLRDRLPGREVDLIDVFEAAIASADPNTLSGSVTDALIEAAGWDPAELDHLTGPNGFNLADADFTNETWLLRLQKALMLNRRLGISTEKLFDWAQQAPDASQAADVVRTVKAKYEDAQWLTVAKSLNDGLRERQRAALVQYILAHEQIVQEGITTSNQLFEYFLVDVEMDPCMKTSRIKQANASVQLFIQRCLMSLEPQVRPEALDDEQWQWMKNYRVWEANRKVFLYPENWIEPELRDDKSPFFEELESALLQDDVTRETAERVFLSYLEKLDEVARLDIVGLYWEHEDLRKAEQVVDMNGVLHVFGRTFNPPHRYFHRRFDAGTGIWMPWETMNLDIQGDDDGGGVHLIPVIYNRRLYLFWPVFTKKADSNVPEGHPPIEYWEVQLAWSHYRQGTWAPKQASADALIVPFYWQNDSPSLPARREITFNTAVFGSVLNINVVLTDAPQPKADALINPNPESTKIYGIFWMDGCRDRLTLYWPHDPIETGYYSPVGSNIAYMAAHQEFDEHGQLKLDDLTLRVYNREKDVAKDPSLAASTLGVEVLKDTPSPYRVLFPHNYRPVAEEEVLGELYPFIYQDGPRTYAASPVIDSDGLFKFKWKDSIVLSTSSFQPAVRSVAQHDAVSHTGAAIGLAAGAGNESRLPSGGVTRKASNLPPPVRAQAGSVVDRTFVKVNGSLLAAHVWEAVKPLAQFLKFETFYHPHVCAWVKALNQYGISGLLTLGNQQSGPYTQTTFQQMYTPTSVVHPAYPSEEVDFDREGAYALYNWELFFHAPLLIADRLRRNQRFEEAQQWFHHIFNPLTSTDAPAPQRYWNVVPFSENADPEAQQIQQLLLALNEGDKAVQHQVAAWRATPFSPHLLARMRVTAYQKTVVMKYIDNLIAWGDQLFRRDTIESINEATQLYMLAANMLGPRPESIPAAGTVSPETYASLKEKQLDALSNALVAMETTFPYGSNGVSNELSAGAESLNLGVTFYFCIPQNDKLLGYWDTVEDRLFKIRHCMNIKGVVRELPLFEPPIDPALLVRAFAMGVDISSVLNDLHAPLPHYRFGFMVQKALELCAEVKALGTALLSALEKKDAEQLAGLRVTHETSLLEAVRAVKKQQVEEATTAREGLDKAYNVTEARKNFYEALVTKEDEKRIAAEKEQLAQLASAHDDQQEAQHFFRMASIAAMIPDFTVGGAGPSSPVSTMMLGGSTVANALRAEAQRYESASAKHSYYANEASITGAWQRRDEEWQLQLDLATKELEQIDKQILAAEIREQIAELELDNHEKQIEQAKAVEAFLRDKYTNQELYTWMTGQITEVYFQSYKLAYDVAKRAERAYRYERGLTDSSFIQFGYWDSLRKGLLSGEKLHLDLKRMETAYLDQHRREYEITKQVSLVLHDPMALITFKETGECIVDLPEALFDMDYPGHYMRRIKSVSLTIPCVTGPYTNVNCTLTLLKNTVRIDSNAQQDYAEQEEDERFVTNFAAIQSIATSHAQGDTGLFELNFRDERYLPFEGAGAISRWRIEMPEACNAFDFDTISDVILTINYTAREGGALLREKALEAATLPAPPQQPVAGLDTSEVPEQEHLRRLFSARHEFASEWHRFLHPNTTDEQHALGLDLTPERFPYRFRNRLDQITKVNLYVAVTEEVLPEEIQGLTLSLYAPDAIAGVGGDLASVPIFLDGMPHTTFDVESEAAGYGAWKLELSSDAVGTLDESLRTSVELDGEDIYRLKPNVIRDVILVFHYVA